mmetsp:Transcript_415/g.984  ORF Transcript_415/g.984 Transcript_415/m.984 type:complete len:183 (-) Transcript_415:591-1139(-)
MSTHPTPASSSGSLAQRQEEQWALRHLRGMGGTDSNTGGAGSIMANAGGGMGGAGGSTGGAGSSMRGTNSSTGGAGSSTGEAGGSMGGAGGSTGGEGSSEPSTQGHLPNPVTPSSLAAACMCRPPHGGHPNLSCALGECNHCDPAKLPPLLKRDAPANMPIKRREWQLVSEGGSPAARARSW